MEDSSIFDWIGFEEKEGRKNVILRPSTPLTLKPNHNQSHKIAQNFSIRSGMEKLKYILHVQSMILYHFCTKNLQK